VICAPFAGVVFAAYSSPITHGLHGATPAPALHAHRVRVSTKAQTENLSLRSQLRACEEYCRRQSYEIVARFHEAFPFLNSTLWLQFATLTAGRPFAAFEMLQITLRVCASLGG
jgi:hypothetical protein